MILATLNNTKSIVFDEMTFNVGDVVPFINGYGNIDDIKIICFYKTDGIDNISFSGTVSSTGLHSQWHSLKTTKQLKDKTYKLPKDFIPYWVKKGPVQYKLLI